MLLLTATSDWYLLNAFPHSSASHIRHFVILDISLKTFCRPLFVSGSNYTNIVNAWRLLQSYWLQPALSLRFLRLRSGKILFACWQRNASDLKTARLLLFCGRVNAAQGDEEDVGYTLEQRGQDPQKMEQTFTSCEQGLYYSSTRYPQRSEGHLFHVSYSHCGSLQKGSSVTLPETVRERSINISSFSAANKSINEFTAGDFRFPFS